MPKESTAPLKSEEPRLPNLGVATLANPRSLPTSMPLTLPVKSEVRTEVSSSNPFKSSSLEMPYSPVKMEGQCLGSANPFTPLSVALEPRTEIPSPSEAALQEIVKLQAKQTELSALIAEQQRISSLPIQEPPIFNGNYFDYPVFMRAFETIIEARVLSDKERLYFLNKYTTGKANDVIKGFITINSSDSYQRAKNLLSQRFGDLHRVSDAYKSHLKKWPQIGEGQSMDLQAFADFLGQCEEAMRSMKFMSDLNSMDVLKQVSSKLPSYSGVKWCRHAFEVKENYGRAVTFPDLVKFAKTEADLAADPVFSPDILKSERKKCPDKDKKPSYTNRRHPPNSNSFATTTRYSPRGNSPTSWVSSQPRVCPVCSNTHTLSNCEEFKKKPLEERLDSVQSMGLCFGCLSKGHYSKNYRKRMTCQKCGRPHPAILHYDPENGNESRDSEKTNSNSNQSSSNTSSVCHTVGEMNSVTTSMIVPVWLQHKDSPDREVLVYALLDEASDSTFIKSETLRDLGLNGPEIKLNLFTMLGKEEIYFEKICGLVVQRIDNRVEIELPKSYSRTSIPFRRKKIPTPRAANEWPHLKKITDKLHPHQSGTDVGLLIGCNCPRVIKPREVILGRGDDPYTVRTLLGWGIIGPITPLQEGEESEEDAEVTTCHRIISREIGSDITTSLNFIPKVQSKEEISPNTVKKMFEMDFSERNSAQEALSQEDRKFLALIESRTHHCEDGHYEMPLPLRDPTLNLPNNREVALRRLSQLKRRFKADKKYKDDYTAFMGRMINSGFAEKVPSTEAEVCGKANPNHSQEGKVGTSHTMACITRRNPQRFGLSLTAQQNTRTSH